MKTIKPLTDEQIISEVVRIVKKYLPDVRIILFGSRAKGSDRPNSDFDFAIDTNKKVSATVKFSILDELEALPTLKLIDIIYLNEVDEEFKEIVLKTGKVVYDGSRIPDK